MKVAVIGFGYWGPNIVRNFSQTKDIQVAAIADLNPKALSKAKDLYPSIPVTTDIDSLFKTKDIDAVAIITPVFTHYALAKKALLAGKHVFIEKPFTQSSVEAQELVELAEKAKLIIMVDHTFLFTAAVKKLKELLDSGEIGAPLYYDSIRVNLGLFQHDVNVIWDLAPHDFSIIDHLFKEKPVALSATGQTHYGSNLEDVAYVTLRMGNDLLCHFNFNWLSPVKVRRTLLGGQNKMVIWDDLAGDEKIKIYNRGIDVSTQEGVYNLLVQYRMGDMHSPQIPSNEALKEETAYFRDCVLSGKKPFNDGEAGLRIVKMLEAADKSLRSGSQFITL